MHSDAPGNERVAQGPLRVLTFGGERTPLLIEESAPLGERRMLRDLRREGPELRRCRASRRAPRFEVT